MPSMSEPTLKLWLWRSFVGKELIDAGVAWGETKSKALQIAIATALPLQGRSFEIAPVHEPGTPYDQVTARAAPSEYEYVTRYCGRKQENPGPPEGVGWEPDPDRGRAGESWERFDNHEEWYWRRRRPG